MNRNEHLNREAKVARLVEFLDTYGDGFATSATIRALSSDQRNAVCLMAGERPASSATWASVVGEFAEREARKLVSV
jgi:hypothetical protein